MTEIVNAAEEQIRAVSPRRLQQGASRGSKAPAQRSQSALRIARRPDQAGDLMRLGQDRQQDPRQMRRAVRRQRNEGGLRQVPRCRIGDRSQDDVGQFGASCRASDDEALEIDRQGPSSGMERRLLRRCRHDRLATEDVAHDGACARAQRTRPSLIRRVTRSVRGDHGLRHDERAGTELRRETAGYSKADEPLHASGDRWAERCRGASGMSARADDEEAGVARKTSLGAQPGDGDDRHNPTVGRAVLLLLCCRLR
jgi:hypothetical protein